MIRIKKGVLLFSCVALTNIAFGQTENKDTVKSVFNKPLADRLDSILNDDQKGREQVQQIAMNGIKDTASFMVLVMKMNQQDAVNQAKVEAILDKYGWLGPDVVGRDGNQALFLVIQHAGQEIQEKYLPMLQEAVKTGKANAGDLALLEDRVLLKEGKKQLYGSQLASDKTTGALIISPIEDPDNLDKRRASVGLPPMDVYCKFFNLKWDLERYKKGLPLLKMDDTSKN